MADEQVKYLTIEKLKYLVLRNALPVIEKLTDLNCLVTNKLNLNNDNLDVVVYYENVNDVYGGELMSWDEFYVLQEDNVDINFVHFNHLKSHRKPNNDLEQLLELSGNCAHVVLRAQAEIYEGAGQDDIQDYKDESDEMMKQINELVKKLKIKL